MQLKAFLSIVLATLATSLPTPSTLNTRETEAGTASSNDGSIVRTLVVNGGCQDFPWAFTKANIKVGFRCRFYSGYYCDESTRIGGEEGLPGNGGEQGISKSSWSATCWSG